jgi:hypothetical protein
MGEFDFSFGDLSSSLGEGSPVLQPSQFSLGAESAGPALDASQFSLGGAGGGFTSPTQGIPSGEGLGDPSAFQGLAQSAQGIAKAALPIAQLGTAGVGLAGGIQAAKTSAQQAQIQRQAQRMQGDVLRSQQAAAAPLTQFGQNELQQATAGQIPPQIQAKIDAWAQGAKAKARDFAARSGQGNSTMLTQWESWIDQQAQAMAADYLERDVEFGVKALSSGAGALAGAGQNAASLQQGAAAEQGGMARLMDEANRALASLSAGAA